MNLFCSKKKRKNSQEDKHAGIQGKKMSVRREVNTITSIAFWEDRKMQEMITGVPVCGRKN